MTHRILNSRQKKKITREWADDFGTSDDLLSGCVAYGDKKETWIASRGCMEKPLTGFAVESVGLKASSNGNPTISAVQLLFGNAPSGELSLEQAKRFIERGEVEGKNKIASYRGHPIDSANVKNGMMTRRNSKK